MVVFLKNIEVFDHDACNKESNAKKAVFVLMSSFVRHTVVFVMIYYSEK